MGGRTVASLAPGASNAAISSVTIPSTLKPGTYYYGALADQGNLVAESNEANNAKAGNTVVIAGSDLVISAVSGPATAATGQTIILTNTVTNQGAGVALDFYVGLYLSTDATITSADIYVDSLSVVGGLASGASNTASSSVTIHSTLKPGTYYYGAIADNYAVVAESNETNNAKAGNTVVISP